MRHPTQSSPQAALTRGVGRGSHGSPPLLHREKKHCRSAADLPCACHTAKWKFSSTKTAISHQKHILAAVASSAAAKDAASLRLSLTKHAAMHCHSISSLVCTLSVALLTLLTSQALTKFNTCPQHCNCMLQTDKDCMSGVLSVAIAVCNLSVGKDCNCNAWLMSLQESRANISKRKASDAASPALEAASAAAADASEVSPSKRIKAQPDASQLQVSF